MPDRHKLWRRVQHDYEQIKPLAPDGYEPYIQVFLIGRAQPLEPDFVETSRGDDEPWVRFQVLGADLGEEKADPQSLVAGACSAACCRRRRCGCPRR